MKANNFVKIVFLIFITILKIQAQLGYVTCNPPSFHSYNFSTNTFTSLANTPVSFGSGGNLVYDGTNVFAMAGAASGIGRTNFYKYTVATNTWTTMSPLPIAANTGASMLFIGGFLYAQVANSTNAFYKYDIPNNAWSGLASLPGNIDAGGDLDWDGGDYIYSTQGANGSNGFYRYSINGNSWTTLAPTTFGMRDGGSIKYHSSGYIYALRGGGSRIFARYDIASNTWSDAVVTDTPVDVNDGSALVLYNNKFYTPAGDGTTTFIVYDLSTNTWSTSAAPPPSPFPSAIGNGGHMVSNFEIVTPEICTNGIDDDGDGLVDCADPDCFCLQCGDVYSVAVDYTVGPGTIIRKFDVSNGTTSVVSNIPNFRSDAMAIGADPALPTQIGMFLVEQEYASSSTATNKRIFQWDGITLVNTGYQFILEPGWDYLYVSGFASDPGTTNYYAVVQGGNAIAGTGATYLYRWNGSSNPTQLGIINNVNYPPFNPPILGNDIVVLNGKVMMYVHSSTSSAHIIEIDPMSLTQNIVCTEPNLNIAGASQGLAYKDGYYYIQLFVSGPNNIQLQRLDPANCNRTMIATFPITQSDFGTAICAAILEICNNGIDDDGDGLVDCADPDCQNLNILQNGQMYRASGVSNGSPAAPDGWLPGTGTPDVNNPSLNSPYGSGQYRVATWNAGYGNASNYCGLVTGLSVSIAGFGGNESISQTNINTIAGQTYDIHIRWANPGVPGSADPARLVLGFLGQGGAVYSSTRSNGATWYDETLTFTATTTASNATFYLSAESTVSLSYVEVDYIVIVPTGTYFSSSTPDVNYDCMVDCPAIVAEICTNGIDDDGDGLVDCADPDCTPCASLRGDCDGNGVVNSADLTAISTEIFDGDGNTVAAVAGGTYVGTCGCDANGNGTIDAGDLSCASFLISNPGVYPPCMVDPCYGCLIADAGVTITCTPPNYTIFCNPTGSGLAGKFYNITGDITASNVPFGSPQQVGTVQSINGSSVFFTIESTDGNCSIRVVVGND